MRVTLDVHLLELNAESHRLKWSCARHRNSSKAVTGSAWSRAGRFVMDVLAGGNMHVPLVLQPGKDTVGALRSLLPWRGLSREGGA